MTISAEIRDRVRQRANFACEFCGVTETNTGGKLTIDHFQPKSRNGTDNIDNLLYCCIRCNQYKLNYWPNRASDPRLWNPRYENRDIHFLELGNGQLYPVSKTGEFTIKRLRLNRSALVAYRLQKTSRKRESELLSHYREIVELLEQLYDRQTALTQEQQQLLKQQRELLQFFLRQKDAENN